MRVISSGYCLESNVTLSSPQQVELEQSIQRMMQKCPAGRDVRVEVTSVRSDICLNLEVVGMSMPITAFAIGPVFSDVLGDLEMELEIQLKHGTAKWSPENLFCAV